MNDNEPATETQIKKLYAVLHALKISPIMFKYNNSIERIDKLTRRQISDWIITLELQEQENKARQPKDKNMGAFFEEAEAIINANFASYTIDESVKAQLITQIAIELRREEG